ncbi:MAG: hypothetical protein AB7S26_29035 [Sandaracinaceae bacterium]
MAAQEPGTLVAGAWRYRLTKTDVLWAARMVEGETLRRPDRGDDALAVLWTMTSLFAPDGQRAKYGGRRFVTFTDQIRAYSQPINPRWLAEGEFCRPGGRSFGTDACADARLTARARLQRTAWKELDPLLRRVVIAWALGRTRNPVPGAIEFAAANVAASFIARNAGSVEVARIHNTFVATAGSRRTASPVVLATRSRSALPMVALVTIAGLGIVVQKSRRP